MKAHRRLFVVVAASMILLDQITKEVIRQKLPIVSKRYWPKVEVIDGFFNLVHTKNPGAAWGLLGGYEHRIAFFVVVTFVAVGLILFYFRQLRPQDRVMATGLSFVFAGAIGNFIDRIAFGEVTDFLQFYLSGSAGKWLVDTFGSRYWPAFNVADICINVGVGLFIWHVLVIERRDRAADLGKEPSGRSND